MNYNNTSKRVKAAVVVFSNRLSPCPAHTIPPHPPLPLLVFYSIAVVASYSNHHHQKRRISFVIDRASVNTKDKGRTAGITMAVEKDGQGPITSKLKGLALEEAENAENLQKADLNGAGNTTNNHTNNQTHADTNNNNNTDNNENNPPQSQLETDDEPQPELEEGEIVAGAEPSNFAVKHPLQNAWAIWFDNPGKRTNAASWGDFLKKVTTFSTVEDFWRVFNNIKPASTLPQGSNYHIFKDHIEPKWEDPQNSKGGKWTVSVPPKNRATALDQMWLFAVLSCIGETIRAPDDVCGLVVSIRKAGDRVQIWTKDASNENACREIGRSLKEALELPDNVIIGYQSHADSMKKSTTKNKYEL